ncbi:hypothetical protein J4410_05920 [Candidatus Woesearchaeota archaeon]|nr:hypothetical protein [Candidatus Woesearchaeota archaeon]
MTPYTHRIIRHGPKNPVQEHNTGQEAGLDPARLHLIDEYVHRLSPLYRGKRVAVHGGSLPRAYQTGERIQAILCSQGVDVGFSIDDLLSPFVGEQGRINLMPARFPRLWGEAQKEGNPDKEDAGLQAWVETGVDTNFDGDGITLREIAYRIGKHILRSIEEYRQGNTLHRISVSHSGFIEPWVYLVLQAREQMVHCFP